MLFLKNCSLLGGVLMRKTGYLAGFVTAAIIFTVGVDAVEVSARSAIVIEASGGTVVYEKDADTRRPMASTTKIMTALCAIESGRLDETVSVSPDAVGVEGSSIYLEAGDKLTLLSLVKALMLESANDAAEAIAVAVSGSVEEFAVLMNQKAEELGLLNTHFTNPHGLSDEEHYTTARELALLSAYAMKNGVFRDIVSTVTERIECGDSYRMLTNHNKMLKIYDGAVGVKTGFTKLSGRCLVSAAERDGVMLVAVTLNAPDDWNDHAAMLDLGFDTLCREMLMGEGEFVGRVPCLGGTEDEVRIVSREAISAILPRSHGEITSKVILPHYFYAPVEAGVNVGKVEFYLDGGLIGSVPLYTEKAVSGVEYKKNLFERIFE